MPQSQEEIIRAAREVGWAEGYEACRRGEQKHNPYRRPRPSDDLHEGAYGVGNSQPYS